jgi:hypothetical protein
MSDFFYLVEGQLLDAARRRGPSQAHRTAVIAAILAVLIAAPAVATVAGVWKPFGGHTSHSTTHAPPPRAMLRVLGVLRRPQTPAERSPLALRTARRFGGADVAGAHLEHIRRVSGTPDTGYVYIVPVDRVGLLVPPPRRDPKPGVCLVTIPAGAIGGGGGCEPFGYVTSGRGFASSADTAYALVPDGVARVEAVYRGRVLRARVRENLFFLDMPGNRLPSSLTWYDAGGRRIKLIRFGRAAAADARRAPAGASHARARPSAATAP